MKSFELTPGTLEKTWKLEFKINRITCAYMDFSAPLLNLAMKAAYDWVGIDEITIQPPAEPE